LDERDTWSSDNNAFAQRWTGREDELVRTPAAIAQFEAAKKARDYATVNIYAGQSIGMLDRVCTAADVVKRYEREAMERIDACASLLGITTRGTDADVHDASSDRDEFPAQPAGGDAACWLHLTCPDCGAIIDRPTRTEPAVCTRSPMIGTADPVNGLETARALHTFAMRTNGR